MSKEQNLEKKAAVVGVGGVGGYLAGMLAKTYPHVSVVARGARGESIRKEGIRLHSGYHGEVVSHPEVVVNSAEELTVQDIIFVCVKNYSLEEALEQMKPAIGENTILVPVMNGVDPGERTTRQTGCKRVVESLIYIVAFANPDYSITQQGKFASIRIGRRDGLEGDAVAETADFLAGADIDCRISKNIAADIWKKYILNCAYNVSTAFYDNTIGELRSDPKKSKEYEDLVYEAYAVALAKGVQLEKKYADQMVHSFHHELADNATSSLQRDVKAGKPSEMETFSGYLVREANALGVPVPVSERMYEGLLAGAGR